MRRGERWVGSTALAVAFALVWPGVGRGDSGTAASTPPTAPASAIARVAQEIARGIGAAPGGVLVVASPLVSDISAPKGDELAVRVATQIAGRFEVARAHPQPAALPLARSLGGRAASLVYVQLEIAKGSLRATADLYPVVSNGWDRLRNPVPGPRAHAFATAPLDAETRSFLTPILLEQAKIHKAVHEEGEVLAIGCGDVDDDGGLEVAMVSRSRVTLARVRGDRVVIERQAPWAKLAPRVPVPMREPLAYVLVSPRGHRGEILVGSTDRGGLALDVELVPKRPLTGIPVPSGDGEACAVVVPDASVFDGHAVACTEPERGEPRVVLQAPAPRYDAIAAVSLVTRSGTVSEVVASREPSGKLRLRRSDPGAAKPLEATLSGIGAQVALLDLDLDGVPEVATSLDSADDALVISSWNATGQFAPRLRLPAKEGVRAIAACPPEERGIPALVAVVGNEVWLVR